MAPRRRELEQVGGQWRGTIYAADGVTPSLQTPLVPSVDLAVCELDRRWEWLCGLAAMTCAVARAP